MGATFSQIDDLLHNPKGLELKTLFSANKNGLLLLGGLTLAVVMLVETVLVLAILSCRVPALRRQGIGCSSGFFWRLGGCICIRPRRLTDAEMLAAEKERWLDDEAGFPLPRSAQDTSHHSEEQAEYEMDDSSRHRQSYIDRQYRGAPPMPPLEDVSQARQRHRSAISGSTHSQNGQLNGMSTFETGRRSSEVMETIESPAGPKKVQQSPKYDDVINDYAKTEGRRSVPQDMTTFTAEVRGANDLID